MSRVARTAILWLLAASICLVTYDPAEARGRGGGGRSMSRGGAAASGSFNRSHARPQRSQSRGVQRRDASPDRYDDRQDRFDKRQDNLSDRQDFRKEVHNDRKEVYNDRKEWYEDRWRRGRYVSVSSWGRVGCTTTIYVNGVRYYECGGVRYEQVYRSGAVVYIIVD